MESSEMDCSLTLPNVTDLKNEKLLEERQELKKEL